MGERDEDGHSCDFSLLLFKNREKYSHWENERKEIVNKKRRTKWKAIESEEEPFWSYFQGSFSSVSQSEAVKLMGHKVKFQNKFWRPERNRKREIRRREVEEEVFLEVFPSTSDISCKKNEQNVMTKTVKHWNCKRSIYFKVHFLLWLHPSWKPVKAR